MWGMDVPRLDTAGHRRAKGTDVDRPESDRGREAETGEDVVVEETVVGAEAGTDAAEVGVVIGEGQGGLVREIVGTAGIRIVVGTGTRRINPSNVFHDSVIGAKVILWVLPRL